MEAALSKTLFTVGGQAVTGGGLLTGVSMLQNISAANQQRAVYNQQAAGVMQEREGLKEQAHIEKLKAQEESNLRRERLLNALAAQNVRAGAAGIKGGTVEQMRLQATEQYEQEQAGADLMTEFGQTALERRGKAMESKASGLRSQGKQAQRGALASTGLTLLKTG